MNEAANELDEEGRGTCEENGEDSASRGSNARRAAPETMTMVTDGGEERRGGLFTNALDQGSMFMCHINRQRKIVDGG